MEDVTDEVEEKAKMFVPVSLFFIGIPAALLFIVVLIVLKILF